jgi:uncharacterized protein (TIGR02599 family)
MRTSFPRRRRPETAFPAGPDSAFTLVEVLVTLALLALILVTLVEFMTNTERVWRSAATDPFGEAESAFETMVDRLADATLDPYQDYADVSGAFRTTSSGAGPAFVPDHPARRSDLAFVCGPGAGPGGWLTPSGRITSGDSLFFVARRGYTQTEAHLGLERLLNAMGYFIEFSDQDELPAFVLPGAHRWRWRLKAVEQPSESLGIYQLPTSSAWVQSLVQSAAPVSILAENVVALVVLPERNANDDGPILSPDFRYDSRDSGNPLTRHQLPPRVRIALVAIDEASAQILAAQNGAQPPALVPDTLFVSAAQLDADLATLDAALTSRKIQHRIFQREILLPAAAWTDTPSS